MHKHNNIWHKVILVVSLCEMLLFQEKEYEIKHILIIYDLHTPTVLRFVKSISMAPKLQMEFSLTSWPFTSLK